MARKQGDNPGFSVVIVMALLAAITSLALAAGRTALDHRTRSAFYSERIHTRHAALSGIDAGAYLLQMDQTPWDGPGDTWCEGLRFSLNNTAVSVTVEDEQAAISLNHLLLPSGEPNLPLIKAASHCIPDIPDFGDRWRMFIRARRDTGGFRPVSHNVMKHFVSLNVRDRQADVLYRERFARSFSAFGSGRINLNTASLEILRALGGPELERAVIHQRRQAPLESVFEIPDAAVLFRGLASVVDIKSSFFTINAVSSGSFVTCHAQAVIWRRSTDVIVLRHRVWWS